MALSDAWQKGAQQLTEAQRISFANDPLNLLAVDGPTNQQKSDGDAATWLPPNKSFRCDYVARQISVKASYGLWVTQAEHDAMARVLADCRDTTAPAGEAAPAPAAPASVPGRRRTRACSPARHRPRTAVYYANCAAARAAGAAPLRAGQPGYREQDGRRPRRRRLRIAAASPVSPRRSQFFGSASSSRAQRMKPRCEYACGWFPRWVSVPGSYSSGSSPVGPNRLTSWSNRSQASSIRPTAT